MLNNFDYVYLICLIQESSSAEHSELEAHQEKIATLTASLATVMQQKSKMEASYQADKKKMMVHYYFLRITKVKIKIQF